MQQTTAPRRTSVAVIGSGAAGLGAAWLLARGNYSVTLYEASSYAGGHARTIEVPIPNSPTSATIPVDVGFIVYNTRTYPDLVSLFELLGVEEDNSSMSFATSTQLPDGSLFEWGSDSLATLFANKPNLYRPAMYTMLFDMRRFNNAVHDFVARLDADPDFPRRNITLEEFLDAGAYSTVFTRCYLVPMVSAVWSASFNSALSFPARSLFHFFVNHGLAQVFARPQWRTPAHRSRDYVTKLLVDFRSNGGAALLNTRVTSVSRNPDYVTVHTDTDEPKRFDHVVFATHAPTTLQLLGDHATEDEIRILGSFQYAVNTAYVHYDPRLMPSNKAVWGAWNFISRPPPPPEHEQSHQQPPQEGEQLQPPSPDDNPVCVSYWLNKLQNYHKYSMPVPDLFITLNPITPIDPDKKLVELTFEHPQFTEAAVHAQPFLQSVIQGQNRSWFCGAYARYGFHEDAMMTGLDVAERLSGYANLRPWRAKHALAINDHTRRFELPCSPLRNPVLVFIAALAVINAVISRLQQGLGKIARRMADTDPVIVISAGDGRLHKFGPQRIRTRSRSSTAVHRSDELSSSALSLPQPQRARVTVKSPRVLVRIAESLGQGYELAPTAAAAFAAAEVDCPSPSDLSVALRALFIADGLDLDPSKARKGRAKFAESLLNTIVGGFKKINSLATHTRLPELTTCISNVVYPSWWLQSNGESDEACDKADGSQSVGTLSVDDLRSAATTLELLGDLSEQTVSMLQRNSDFHATIVVQTQERMSFVSRKAELLFVRSQIDIFVLNEFLKQRRSELGPSTSIDQDERLYELILSPALLNVFHGCGFASLPEALNFLRELAAPEAVVELGASVFGTRRTMTPARKAHGTDSLFCGDDGFLIWKVPELLHLTEQSGFELQQVLFMDNEEAAMDVSDATQRVYTSLATEKLEAEEIRMVLAQLCLWEAALQVKYVRRMALTFKLT